jgi:tetratricopeptide (TPR) repeat protein
MGRFSKLDFEHEARPVAPVTDPWPNLDEQQCMREGDEKFELGEYEPALNSTRVRCVLNRDLVEAWVGQIRCLICLGEYPEAVTWSDRSLERFPKSADLLACKGLALVKMGDIAEGIEYSDGAIQRRSPSVWVWLARGQSLLLGGQQPANAQRCFLKAQELAPGDWHCELQVAMAYNSVRDGRMRGHC